MVDAGTTDIHRMSFQSLDREVHGKLHVGSPLRTVQDYLKERGIEYSFEASTKTLYATARNLRGSTIASTKSLTIEAHFDDAATLKCLKTKESYTGP